MTSMETVRLSVHRPRPRAGRPAVGARCGGSAGTPGRRRASEHRPDDVELLLDGEGPEVLERRRCRARLLVVQALLHQVVVHGVERGEQPVLGGVRDLQDRTPDGGDADRRHDHDEGGRQQPPDPPCVEPADRHSARALHLADEMGGDEEAGDDEEDVDADVAAGHGRDAAVVQHDDGDGDRPQTLDVRPEPGSPRRLGGVVAARDPLAEVVQARSSPGEGRRSLRGRRHLSARGRTRPRRGTCAPDAAGPDGAGPRRSASAGAGPG